MFTRFKMGGSLVGVVTKSNYCVFVSLLKQIILNNKSFLNESFFWGGEEWFYGGSPLFGLQHCETLSCQQFVTFLIIMDVVCIPTNLFKYNNRMVR